MIVLDASVVVELLLGTPTGEEVARRLGSEAGTLHAPHLLDLEVAQVLRRYERTGEIDTVRAGEAVQDLADLDAFRYPHDVLLPRIWELRANCTAYDACYVALAESLAAPLWTTDARLAGTPGVDVAFEVLRAP
ncbi:MAG: type II toxin-antitoxin system VapC family toxin [Myxococcota bacterium]